MSGLVRTLIMWLVVLSVLLQATSAVAGSINTHMFGSGHAPAEHTHSKSVQPSQGNTHIGVMDIASIDNHDKSDCHHCGHCSGNHLSWVPNLPQLTLTTPLALQFPHLPISNLPDRVNELLRPPIS